MRETNDSQKPKRKRETGKSARMRLTNDATLSDFISHFLCQLFTVTVLRSFDISDATPFIYLGLSVGVGAALRPLLIVIEL